MKITEFSNKLSHLLDFFFLFPACSYLSALILVEGMEIDSLHERALDDRTEEHKLANCAHIHQVKCRQGNPKFSLTV